MIYLVFCFAGEDIDTQSYSLFYLCVCLFQELSAEKDEGTQNIHQTIESGERLYPSTASEGRDIIRQDIRSDFGFKPGDLSYLYQ